MAEALTTGTPGPGKQELCDLNAPVLVLDRNSEFFQTKFNIDSFGFWTTFSEPYFLGRSELELRPDLRELLDLSSLSGNKP